MNIPKKNNNYAIESLDSVATTICKGDPVTSREYHNGLVCTVDIDVGLNHLESRDG